MSKRDYVMFAVIAVLGVATFTAIGVLTATDLYLALEQLLLSVIVARAAA